MNLRIPDEIKANLRKFKNKYPDPKMVGFLMMSFKTTMVHANIVDAIIQTLTRYDLIAVRADASSYNEILVLNVKTYMWGCGFGIAVFDRIASEEFNPNVSFEVGYMLALRRPVFILKDKTLPRLPTDLVGKLYEDFDTQDPATSIPPKIEKWLRERMLIPAIKPPNKALSERHPKVV